MFESQSLKWQFWSLWVVASGVAGALIALVARAAAYSVGYGVGEAGGTVLGEAALGIVALGGFMGAMGVAQWLVMLKQVDWAGRWMIANALSGAFSGAVMLSLLSGLTPIAGQTVAAILGVAFGLAVFVATQWMVLRGAIPWAGKLALASAAGLVGAATLGGGVIGSLVGGEFGAGAGFGTVYGVITGGAIVLFNGGTKQSTSAPQHAAT